MTLCLMDDVYLVVSVQGETCHERLVHNIILCKIFGVIFTYDRV